jgi:hypothetical protein
VTSTPQSNELDWLIAALCRLGVEFQPPMQRRMSGANASLVMERISVTDTGSASAHCTSVLPDPQE